jgi:ElaA protein
MENYRLKRFEELSNYELYALLQLRERVFVVEQNCPYLDCDGKDLHAYHLWIPDEDGVPIAYCRILPKGVSYEMYASIGRVVSHPKHRNTGAGRALMSLALELIVQLFPGQPVKISAQQYLLHFYQEFGFVQVGEMYLEDEIPHVAMVWALQ